MFDLTKESFDYNGWHFEFYESPEEMYLLIAYGRKNDKAINWKLTISPPTYVYDKFYLTNYIEKEQKKQIALFKEYILKGELELL